MEASPDQLYDAVQEGQLDIVKQIIEGGADINAEGKAGHPPLNHAAACGHKTIAEYLISKGADIEGKDSDGYTSLHTAAFWASEEVAEILLAKGADVNAQNKSIITPLHSAAGAWDPRDKGMIFMAVSIWFDEEKKKATLEISKMLISKGADVNARDVAGYTPLHWAAQRNRIGLAELLISRGADINLKSKRFLFMKGKTPIEYLTNEEHKEMIEFLKKYGAK